MNTNSSEAPQPEYSEDGVDLSLIRWFLSLTPPERLQFAQEHVNAILRIRELNGASSPTSARPNQEAII